MPFVLVKSMFLNFFRINVNINNFHSNSRTKDIGPTNFSAILSFSTIVSISFYIKYLVLPSRIPIRSIGPTTYSLKYQISFLNQIMYSKTFSFEPLVAFSFRIIKRPLSVHVLTGRQRLEYQGGFSIPICNPQWHLALAFDAWGSSFSTL